MNSVNIIDAGLSFGSLSRRGSTNRIILHHAEASECSPEDIQRWHLANGWSGAGYHFEVRKNGTVHSLRPEWAVGSHAQGSNYDSIGICFEGNYMTEEMPKAQLDAGRELIAHLKAKYGIDTVLRHKDVYDTNCPGDNFPFEELVGVYPNTEKEDELIRVDIPAGTYPVYRAYRADTDDHFLTGSKAEYDNMPAEYSREGVAFYGVDSGEIVYRIYNPNSEQHHYTVDYSEAKKRVDEGWKAETVTFASARNVMPVKPVYRVYNPNTGAHHFTTDIAERDMLVDAGWNDEGIRWYAAG